MKSINKRTLVLTSVVILLPMFFGLDGVLYSMPVSDILTFIISAVIIVKTYRELNMEGAQIA